MHAFHSFGFTLVVSPITLRRWWFARCQKYRLACSLYSGVKLKLPLLLAPHVSCLLDFCDYESTVVSYIGDRCFLSSFPAPLLSYLLVWQYVQCLCLFLSLSSCLSLCLSVSLCHSVSFCLCASLSLSASPSVCLSASLSVSVSLFVRLSVPLSICLCLFVSVCLSLFICLCLPVYLWACLSAPPPPPPPTLSLSLSRGGDDAHLHENSCLPKGSLVTIELFPQSCWFWPSFTEHHAADVHQLRCLYWLGRCQIHQFLACCSLHFVGSFNRIINFDLDCLTYEYICISSEW